MWFSVFPLVSALCTTQSPLFVHYSRMFSKPSIDLFSKLHSSILFLYKSQADIQTHHYDIYALMTYMHLSSHYMPCYMLHLDLIVLKVSEYENSSMNLSEKRTPLSMVTIKDIASELGVAASTVSKGLNGGSDISEQLRTAILEKAVEMGYESKRSKKTETRTLAVFIENMEYEKPDQFGYNIVLGFRQAAFKGSWDIDLVPITPEFQKDHPLPLYMVEKHYSAACMLGMALEDPWMGQMDTVQYPTVLLDNFIPVNPMVGSVGTDSSEAMEMAVSHLIELGHEKIAFLDGSAHSYISDQRMKGYLASMKKHHLPIDPNLAIYAYFVEDAAHHHVPGMLDLGATAIICGNDLLAIGAAKCCRSLGFRVPEDVSIIGYDDIPLAAKFDPPLTTIHQDLIGLGRACFYTLHAMLDDVNLNRSMLRPKLVVRRSTAPAVPRLVTKRVESHDSVLYVNPALYTQVAD